MKIQYIILFRANDDLIMHVSKEGEFKFVHLSWDTEPGYFGEIELLQTLKRSYTTDEYIINLIEDGESGSILSNNMKSPLKSLIIL